MTPGRDLRPAVGSRGGPASWRRARAGAAVALHRRRFEDARWSFLYGPDTSYADSGAADPVMVAAANRRGRGGDVPVSAVQGPVMKPPVWTWEIPVYFWSGGMAAGASFVAVACDAVGDARAARVARAVALGALAPSPALLVKDLGRPARFLNMLRVFKPRSPMSTGAWCLSAFGALASGAVAGDLAGRRRLARWAGAGAAATGVYLGSYTGVLLAATAVPVWSRSRSFLGPVFVSTATASGAAACRLALTAAGGARDGDATRVALGRVEAGAMVAELVLSAANERRLPEGVGQPLSTGEGGRWFRRASWLARAGLALRAVGRRGGVAVDHGASVAFLAAALCFRFGWVRAGVASAGDDEVVVRVARELE